MSDASPASPRRALVYGFAVAGQATAAALVRRGIDVIVADDSVDEQRRTAARELGVPLVEGPFEDAALADLCLRCDTLVPAPGVPETHPLFTAAGRADIDVRSEIDLAYLWEQERLGGPRPMVTVTGTDGKTTTTLMAVAMLRAAGVRTDATGNTELPLVSALDHDFDAFVVEATSFRLCWTPSFRSVAAAWLNLAPDHLNWHRDMGTYEAAKARLWANMRPTDTAIGWIDDPVVMGRLRRVVGRQITFGHHDADYFSDGETLQSPHGPICGVADIPRGLPHDVTNALAAAALVMEAGLADARAVARGLRSFVGPPHRIELVGEAHGVRWYNDSKATTPHAAATAIAAFDSVVLIAGGKNKGLDLSPMAAHAPRVRAVLAIGDAADAVRDAFDGHCRVIMAGSLDRAVAQAGALAEPGDVVLLSPGCASFDAFDNFEHRGTVFTELVGALLSDLPSERVSAVGVGEKGSSA